MKTESQNNNLPTVNHRIHPGLLLPIPRTFSKSHKTSSRSGVSFRDKEKNNLLTIFHKQGMKLYRISCGLEWFQFWNFFHGIIHKFFSPRSPSHHILDNMRLSEAYSLFLSPLRCLAYRTVKNSKEGAAWRPWQKVKMLQEADILKSWICLSLEQLVLNIWGYHTNHHIICSLPPNSSSFHFPFL